MQASQGAPAAPGPQVAPFRADAPAPASGAPFGIAPGQEPNPELTQALDSFFGTTK